MGCSNPLYCVYNGTTIPQRFVMAIVMHLCFVNAYHLRVVLNIAMTEILEEDTQVQLSDSCPMYNLTRIAEIRGGRYKWPSDVEALILYAFYFGYIISHIPGGRLADMFGARRIIGCCMSLSILVTLLYPAAIKYGGYKGALGLRVMLGLVQGPLCPTISTLIQCWVPEDERSFLGGIAQSGSNLGTITGNLLTGIIMHETSSWEWAFYIWSLIAMAWLVIFFTTVFSYPATHPFITMEEEEYLGGRIEKRTQMKVPWLEIFKSRAVYALIVAEFGHDFTYYLMVTDLPKFLNNILKLDVKSNAIYTAVPFTSIWLASIAWSYLADHVLRRGYLSLLQVRRTWTAFASLASASFMVIAVHVGCSRTWTIVLYTVAMFCEGSIYAGLRVNINDITQHHGGAIMAIVNGTGATAGIIGPFLVGYLTPNHALEEWQKVFWILVGVEVGTTAFYLVFASVEREKWDYPPEG